MRILVISQYYWPENFRINDFAEEFVKRGHGVTVLTAIPDYPDGKFHKGYGIFKQSRELYKGIKIFRAPLIPRSSGTNIRLALNYISYVMGAIFTSLFLLKNKFDIIFVFEPSPITVGIPAIFVKKINKIPLCFWVLDLWPESVVSAGNLNKTSLIPKILNQIVRFICREMKVSERQIMGKSRTMDVALARQIAMYFCKELTETSLSNIGAHIGGRDHSTVIHACKNVVKKIKTDRDFKLKIYNMKNQISG